MSLRLLTTLTQGIHTAKVYRDSEWDEYRVKFYQHAAHLTGADHHTDDRGDAEATARLVLKTAEESMNNTQEATL